MGNKIVFFSVGRAALMGAAGGVLWGTGLALADKIRRPKAMTWKHVATRAFDNSIAGAVQGAGMSVGLHLLRRKFNV